MINWGRKYEGEEITCGWEPPLADGDEVADFTPTVIDGTATLSGGSFEASSVSVRVIGGAAGEVLLVRLAVTTTAGEELEEFASLLVVEDALFEVVTAAELRTHLRDCSDPDGVLRDLIDAAQSYFEEATGMATVQRTETLIIDAWPAAVGGGLGWWDGVRDGAITSEAARVLELPRAPLIAVDHVKTMDAAGTPTTFSSANYYLDTRNKPGRLALVPGAVWPVPERPVAGIEIQYQAGHATPYAMPAAFKMAILQIAAHWYENRELVDLEGPREVPMQAGRIISKFRIVKL